MPQNGSPIPCSLSVSSETLLALLFWKAKGKENTKERKGRGEEKMKEREMGTEEGQTKGRKKDWKITKRRRLWVGGREAKI